MFHHSCGEGFQFDADGNGEEADEVVDVVKGVEHYHREVSGKQNRALLQADHTIIVKKITTNLV